MAVTYKFESKSSCDNSLIDLLVADNITEEVLTVKIAVAISSTVLFSYICFS